MDDAGAVPDDGGRRPTGVSDATVVAVGKLSEAFEWLERARGSLYDFHQMMGHVDLMMGDAADALDNAGHLEMATLLWSDVIGRNALPGRWSFQIVEEFDDTYYGPVRNAERTVRDQLMDGVRHVYEAELKIRRRRAAGRDDTTRSIPA